MIRNLIEFSSIIAIMNSILESRNISMLFALGILIVMVLFSLIKHILWVNAEVYPKAFRAHVSLQAVSLQELLKQRALLCPNLDASELKITPHHYLLRCGLLWPKTHVYPFLKKDYRA